MKKVFATLMAAALMLMGLQAFAQDIILKKDNTMVRANIEEINGENVVYHAFDNPDGPLFKLPISQVAKIQFKNGTEQVFNNTPAPVASPYVAPGFGNQGKLIRDDDQLFINGHELGDEEIKAVIGEQLWQETFASARGQFKAGKVLTNIGIPFAAAGGGLMIAGLILAATTTSTRSSTYEAAAILVGVGAPFFGTGLTLMSIGIPLRCIGNGRMEWVVDETNRNSGYAMQPKVNFGFQQHGVGVSINF